MEKIKQPISRLRAMFLGGLLMTSSSLNAYDVRLLTDFSDSTPGLSWFVVNDNVMGGRSSGGYDIRDGQLIFSGVTNTRGGGFSSIRTRGPSMDLGNFDGVRLRLKGDGRRYSWQIRTNATFRGLEVSYWAEFDTTNGEWIEVDLPFDQFVPRFRGVELEGGPPDSSEVRGMGLMINDGKDGDFTLLLDRVAAYTKISV